MKKRKIFMILAALTLVFAMSVTAFAATTPTDIVDSITAGAMAGKFFGDQPTRPELTAEQKAQMDARREQMVSANDKWNSLTDSQKEEIYKMKDQQSKIEESIIDKYVEWDLIDSETAADMKAQISERSDFKRECGNLPMGGGKGGRAGFAGRGDGAFCPQANN